MAQDDLQVGSARGGLDGVREAEGGAVAVGVVVGVRQDRGVGGAAGGTVDLRSKNENRVLRALFSDLHGDVLDGLLCLV